MSVPSRRLFERMSELLSVIPANPSDVHQSKGIGLHAFILPKCKDNLL
jgi:hypothetical protein